MINIHFGEYYWLYCLCFGNRDNSSGSLLVYHQKSLWFVGRPGSWLGLVYKLHHLRVVPRSDLTQALCWVTNPPVSSLLAESSSFLLNCISRKIITSHTLGTGLSTKICVCFCVYQEAEDGWMELKVLSFPFFSYSFPFVWDCACSRSWFRQCHGLDKI